MSLALPGLQTTTALVGKPVLLQIVESRDSLHEIIYLW